MATREQLLVASALSLVVGCTDSVKPAAKRQVEKPLAPFEVALKQKSPELLLRYRVAEGMGAIHCASREAFSKISDKDNIWLDYESKKHAALCSAYAAASSGLRELGSSGTQLGQLSEFGVFESKTGAQDSLVYELNYVGPFRSPQICAKAEQGVRDARVGTVACREWHPLGMRPGP